MKGRPRKTTQPPTSAPQRARVPLGSYEPGDGVLDPDRHGHRRKGSTVAVLTERGWPGSLVLGSHHVHGRLPLRPTSWAQPGCRCDVCVELCTGA